MSSIKNIRITLAVFGAVVLTLAALPATALGAGFMGPLGARNTHPLAISTGAPVFTSARTSDTAVAVVTHSSTYLVKSSPAWDVAIDLETTTLDIRLEKKILGGRAGLLAYIPVVMHGSGVLDSPLDAFHSAFGFPDYGRSARPDNVFAYDVSKSGVAVVDGRAGRAGLGDITAGVKLALVEGKVAVSVLAFAELPTGDADHGFGTGDVGGGAAFLVDGRVNDRLAVYMNAGYLVPETLRAMEDVGLGARAYGGAGVEWAAFGRLNLNAEFIASAPAMPATGLRELDDTSMLLTFGGRYLIGHLDGPLGNHGSYLEFTFSEDPNTNGAPDFAASVGLGVRY